MNSGQINPLFENEFFDSIQSKNNIDASCSSIRLSRAYRFFGTYDNIPSYYQYFKETSHGGFPAADYCPVSLHSDEENENIYYVGHCSKLGSGDYGTLIKYPLEEEVDINGTKYLKSSFYSNKSADLVDITGETYSNNSFCYQSTLIKNGIKYNASVARAICYESFCSDRSLTIKINDDYFVCPRAGGKIEVEGYNGYFLCADYNLICSGTVMCNELFDCVDKKSETKEETYYYDYTILTSQNLEDAEIKTADNTNNYELSDNGVCPKDCKQCQKNNKCTKCRNNYNLVSSTENSGEIKCSPESEIKIGYYILNNIYYKCMDNCDSCKDGKTCDKCSNGLAYNNGKCIKGIANCETYTKDDKCQKCKSNYGFKEDDRTSCLSISNLENYYTKDGISYYPCDKEIQNCSKCYYNETQSKIKCYLCTNNFFLFESESCLSESNLNSTIYKMNSTHINKCSNAINNCNECTSDKSCTKCANNYYMINDNKTNCVQSSSIPTDQYYLSQDQTMYYACNNSNYNDILNCKSCLDKTSCSLCKDEYTFIDGDKSTCVEITSLSNKYILDPQDKANYIKCISLYSNCNTCNNLKCLTCNDDYTIFNDNCVSKSSLQTSKPIQTDAPTTKPADAPTNKPTESPTNKPTEASTNKPTDAPTNKPTDVPTNKPTEVSVIKPTEVPSNKLTDSPMIKPTEIPSNKPSESPMI